MALLCRSTCNLSERPFAQIYALDIPKPLQNLTKILQEPTKPFLNLIEPPKP